MTPTELQLIVDSINANKPLMLSTLWSRDRYWIVIPRLLYVDSDKKLVLVFYTLETDTGLSQDNAEAGDGWRSISLVEQMNVKPVKKLKATQMERYERTKNLSIPTPLRRGISKVVCEK